MLHSTEFKGIILNISKIIQKPIEIEFSKLLKVEVVDDLLKNLHLAYTGRDSEVHLYIQKCASNLEKSYIDSTNNNEILKIDNKIIKLLNSICFEKDGSGD